MKLLVSWLIFPLMLVAQSCQYEGPLDVEQTKKLVAADCATLPVTEFRTYSDLLTVAIDQYDLASVEFLLEQNVTVTPHHLAEAAGVDNYLAMQRLLASGQSADQTFNGMSILHLAIKHSRYEMVKLLVELGADVNTRAARSRIWSSSVDGSVPAS